MDDVKTCGFRFIL